MIQAPWCWLYFLSLTLCAGDSSCLSACPSEESCPGVMLLLYEDKLTCTQYNVQQMNPQEDIRAKRISKFFFSYCFVLKHYSPHQDTFHTWLPLQRLFMLRLTFISNSTRVRAAQKGWHLVSCPLLPWEIPSPQELRECAETEGVSTNLSQRKQPSKANITHMLMPEMSLVLHQPEPLKCSWRKVSGHDPGPSKQFPKSELCPIYKG